ncbi:MAG: hypothetical protein J7J86_04065 [Bacteroidales bacterium]|nr:hypothetical protein [Bacteroidales bacterium]
MKKTKLLLVAIAVISFTAFCACSGNSSKKATEEKTEQTTTVESTDTTTSETKDTTEVETTDTIPEQEKAK